jgi:hypothetical protein
MQQFRHAIWPDKQMCYAQLSLAKRKVEVRALVDKDY